MMTTYFTMSAYLLNENFHLMNIVICISTEPPHNQPVLHAPTAARKALREGNHILQVFFTHNGVYQAYPQTPARDGNAEATAAWQALAREYSVKLHVCYSALALRGIDDHAPLPEFFSRSGAVDFIRDCLRAEKVITFGHVDE